MLPELNPIELIFLGAVALIFIGPKDLPVVLRKVGHFTARMRGLAAEFRASFDEMARQSELDELRKEVEALRNGQFGAAHTPDLQTHVDEINQHLSTPYWDAPTTYDGAPAYPAPASPEADEVAALPPVSVSAEAPATVAKPARKRAAKLSAPTTESEGAADGAGSAKPPRRRAKAASAAGADAVAQDVAADSALS